MGFENFRQITHHLPCNYFDLLIFVVSIFLPVEWQNFKRTESFLNISAQFGL